MRSMTAARAYQASAKHRNIRDQEAEVFQKVNASMRAAQCSDEVSRTRATADNSRLWTTLMDLMRDPANELPQSLRASFISVGLAVQRECVQPSPDFSFLIGINEQVADGLLGA